jgi:spore coat polysaccharide biosynthesis predicted glycosyltransferase SpsG
MGWGHLVRTQALGVALRRRNVDCVLVTAAEGPFELPHVTVAPHLAPELESTALQAQRPDVVVADLYRPDERRLEALRGPWKLVCIDDEAPIEFDCDLLVNPSLDPDFVHRRAEHTQYMMGGEALLLRQQFQQLPLHPTRENARRLLVCFGGSDPVGMTRKTMGWLNEALPGIERIQVIIGRGFAEAEALRASGGPRTELLHDVQNMAALFVSADLGVFAAGSLLYEAAAAGLPSVFISITDAQRREADAACTQGAGVHLGWYQDVSRPALLGALSGLLNAPARAALSASAQWLVDGRGCDRVADRILGLLP